MTVLEIFLAFLGLYLVAGFFFALGFIVAGVTKIDPAAKGTSWRFRLIIIPGVMALWPLLLKRWASGSTAPPAETNDHRRRALAGKEVTP